MPFARATIIYFTTELKIKLSLARSHKEVLGDLTGDDEHKTVPEPAGRGHKCGHICHQPLLKESLNFERMTQCIFTHDISKWITSPLNS